MRQLFAQPLTRQRLFAILCVLALILVGCQSSSPQVISATPSRPPAVTSSGTPTVTPIPSAAVYTTTSAGHLYALNSGEGTLRWDTDIAGKGADANARALSVPVLADGTLYVAHGGDAISSITASSGKLGATFTIANAGITWLGVVNKTIVAAERYGTALYGVNRDRGYIQWQHRYPSLAGDPVVVGKTIILDEGDVLEGIDATYGNVIWRTTVATAVANGQFVATATRVYLLGADYPAPLLALDPTDGTILWSVQLPFAAASMTLGGSTLYVTSYKRSVTAIDGASGDVLHTTALGGGTDTFISHGASLPPPLIDSAMLYFAADSAGLNSGTRAITALGVNATASVWSYTLPGTAAISGLGISSGVLMISANGITALNSATGMLLWYFSDPADVSATFSSPIIGA